MVLEISSASVEPSDSWLQALNFICESRSRSLEAESPPPVVVCDYAMCSLSLFGFGEPLPGLNSFQIAPCLAEVPIASWNLFKRGIYVLCERDRK